MAYYKIIRNSPYWDHLPGQLHEHLLGEELEDAHVDYKVPEILEEPPVYKEKNNFVSKPTDVRLPARLASPLIPYPQEIKDISSGDFQSNRNMIHGHHYSQLSTLKEVFDKSISAGVIPSGPLKFDMDSLKRFGRQSYSHREDLINLSTLAFARRATCHDLSIAANATVPFQVSTSSISLYTSFIIMIQRLRVHIAKESNYPSFTPVAVPQPPDDAKYIMFDNGVYVYQSRSPDRAFSLMACGGHFRLYHANLGYWFCGPTTYLDYIFTIADISNNLDILRNCDEYEWASEMFKHLISFAEHEGHHKEQVDFMKSLEGFLLNMSDYDETFAMNWKPILEAVHELWLLDQIISEVNYDMCLIISLLRGDSFKYPNSSFLCKFIISAQKLSRTHLQEISALHKLIFYAEVNAEAGVKKFLKRVHTPRQIDSNAVKNITRFAKQSFLVAYKKRHKTIPNLIGPPHKIRLLETYCQQHDYQRVESLPLSWWDDMKIFDCMDNTLTDDPLEFAKDKGALKGDISFGPGDSRKELLQVIEREKYELKDFFKNRKIVPRPKFIRRTTQKLAPEKMKDPARLIEKEREQKYEARLFANGELENKHSLSLVAAKMKKALAYFDEQLMTPTDRKRKALIHEASRELSQTDNYSLLLDIEGHNQSMQHSNTHELAEFLGNLFGYDGWGDLSHYFSQLTVYHYDEYLDKVIESHGQLGGIEGWLNPFWTLHTTIMMKLLRIMTDVNVKTIMVYSDDVNAIVQIKQASEPMVQSVFSKIMKHCSKFGMTVKYSQTMLSKHRITMLRQHYADGLRADSTLKRLISVSAGNNPTIVSDELEVSGICSSASSAMELSNHHEACSYLKNYKLGLLLSRMPQMILSKINPNSMISPEELPAKLSNLLYYSKDDKSALDLLNDASLFRAARNDIAAYLGRKPNQMNGPLLEIALSAVYGTSVAESRLVDSPDRVLYLQVYDEFVQDLLFFWTYLPCNLGGLGASLHINLMLSGHSIGFSKSMHYLHRWICNYSVESSYFMRYLNVVLSVDMESERNTEEIRLVTSTWPGDQRICPATTSVQQSIKSMVRRHTRNKKVIEMFELSDERDDLAKELLEVFRKNFHARIVQFYHENTAIHFIDLLISKIETSSGLLTKVKNLTRLRNSLCFRAIENIRMAADTSRTHFFELTESSDIIQSLLDRKCTMFPKVQFIEVEEVLYDDKISEVDVNAALLTIRRCSPTHYRNGIKVYDDPKVGNETLYKGELLDDDRMLGNKEELLAAKLVAVTKWLLMKNNQMSLPSEELMELDCIKACNLSLSTLTKQTFAELFHFSPTEVGGEIMHRIPNIRFSTSTYIRSEMNRSLHYTTELNQRLITAQGLVDSNVNFDYVRMRFLVAAIVADKYDSLRRLVVRYAFTKLTGIKDVQFVTPKLSLHKVIRRFKCYSDLRGHTLSKMRFRYLSHSYLYEENMNEWALMPKITESQTAAELGRNYVNDILLRYSRDLDKDYMLVTPQMIEAGIWKPVIEKLTRIDPGWKQYSELSDVEEIQVRLQDVMKERCRLTTVDRTNAVQLSLQSQCLEAIAMVAPSDLEYQNLVSRYAIIARNRRHSTRLSLRLAQYQNLLGSLETHRLSLAKSLLHEYIATFHFKTRVVSDEMTIDVEESVREFMETDLGKLSLMIISPDLQVRMMILGFEYVERVANSHLAEILEEYRDLCSDVSMSDVIVPAALPSIPVHTILTGKETLPDSVDEVEYIAHSIPLSAMSTLDQIHPLCKYAHKCATIGARPETFTSLTGSDSLTAQVGLFRMLKSMNIIDEDTKICDLTAGRGDGQYAGNHLGLDITSFSREDTFTRVYHHPKVNFKSDYDVFNGATLKFVTAFEFVHIDISFAGDENSNILDMLIMLEENNLAYSIRMNSVKCIGYIRALAGQLPAYDHYLAYASNRDLKPYQIYLIGVPGESKDTWNGPDIKQTLAFKSMALSFSQLLSPRNYAMRLEEYAPNSASIYLPIGMKMDSFLEMVCDDSIEQEQRYYCDRYMAEIGDGATLQFSYDHLPRLGRDLVQERTRIMEILPETTYSTMSVDQIGNVSSASRPFHEKHVQAMMNKSTPVWSTSVLNCDEPLLEFFRKHHPIQEIRTWCNILLGLQKFCRHAIMSGHKAIADLASELNGKAKTRLSLHQREISLSIKLLVLAARDDDYSYGVRYCHKILKDRTRAGLSISRTLRYYKLLSYIYRRIQYLMAHGQICIRSINAIENEIEVREKTRYRYQRNVEKVYEVPDDVETLEHIISDSVDKLFANLEAFATNLVDVNQDDPSTGSASHLLETAGLNFDIGLKEHIDDMIEKLNLVPSGPHGFIDLGDDDYPEPEDW
jgi:hypothetical protein